MIETLMDLNTKSAVLYLILWMSFFNLIGVVGIVGFSTTLISLKRQKTKEEILDRINQCEKEIIKNIKDN